MEDAAHEDSVQYTLKELRRKIAEHEQQLAKVGEASPSSNHFHL